MSSEGNTTLFKGIPTVRDAFVVIVKTEWNSDVVDLLVEGCEEVLRLHHIKYKVLDVPGVVELPFAIKAWDRSAAQKADAFIMFGTVIRGGTPHFEYVCKIASEGVLQLNLSLASPTIFGVLTVENKQQALDRAGGPEGHKGKEAALTAIKMIALNRQIGQ